MTVRDNSDFLKVAVGSFRQLVRFILREGGTGNDLNQIVIDEERMAKKRSMKNHPSVR